jgi:hypothetical protein
VGALAWIGFASCHASARNIACLVTELSGNPSGRETLQPAAEMKMSKMIRHACVLFIIIFSGKLLFF